MKGLNYGIYRYTGKELAGYSLLSGLIWALISFCFFYSVIPMCLCPLFVLIYLKRKKRELCEKRRRELGIQFKDAIMAVAAALKAGYSAESAFAEAAGDMKQLYGEDSMIWRELTNMNRYMKNSGTLEQALYDLSGRSKVEEIRNFAEVFAAAKRSGGDMVAIIGRSVYIIAEKIEVQREIHVLMSAKLLEQKVMNIIPFFIIFYIRCSSPEFLSILYGNSAGATVMAVCLIIYGIAFLLSEKIIHIEV